MGGISHGDFGGNPVGHVASSARGEKAKKNKALVATAQKEWKLTYAAKQGNMWMRHVKGHSNHEWNEVADELAKKGCSGKYRYGDIPVD